MLCKLPPTLESEDKQKKKKWKPSWFRNYWYVNCRYARDPCENTCAWSVGAFPLLHVAVALGRRGSSPGPGPPNGAVSEWGGRRGPQRDDERSDVIWSTHNNYTPARAAGRAAVTRYAAPHGHNARTARARGRAVRDRRNRGRRSALARACSYFIFRNLFLPSLWVCLTGRAE